MNRRGFLFPKIYAIKKAILTFTQDGTTNY